MGYDIDYLALAPEITVAVAAMVVLSLDLVLGKDHKYWTAIAAVLGVGFAGFPLIALAVFSVISGYVIGPMVFGDFFGGGGRRGGRAGRAREFPES